jgi:hypothetical protein
MPLTILPKSVNGVDKNTITSARERRVPLHNTSPLGITPSRFLSIDTSILFALFPKALAVNKERPRGR